MDNPISRHSTPLGLALTVVDVQGKLAESIVAEQPDFLHRIRLARKLCQLLEIPVAFTEQVPEKLGPTLDSLEVDPSDPVFAKAAFSAFGAEAWVDWLEASEIEHLLLCGIETPICIYQTVSDALRRDIEVTLLVDAVAGRRPTDAPHCLRALQNAGAHILPVETVFYAIMSDAHHPKFRDACGLIKQAP